MRCVVALYDDEREGTLATDDVVAAAAVAGQPTDRRATLHDQLLIRIV